MWTKEGQSEAPASSPSQAATPYTAPGNRPGSPTARTLACLGSTIKVKGEITSGEDLQIDGKVEGSVSLQNHRLIVGRTAQLNSEITSREVIVYGNVVGDLHALDRVEIKKDGEVVGDITTARISIEDGAYFKGHIEIERAKSPVHEKQGMEVPVGAVSN